MRVGSLFSGIGGLDLGLERAGMEIIWQVENDPYCQKVLKKHWPGVPCYGDIKEIDFTTLPAVDLICGGFPCQPYSRGGSKRAENDSRNLWPETFRCIRETAPRWVLCENVSGLLDYEYFGKIIGDLASFGFTVEWNCIPSAIFGSPFVGDRVWLLATTASIGLSESYIELRKLSKKSKICSRIDKGWNGRCVAEPGIERVAHGIPSRVDRLKCLGNAVVPQVAQWLGERIIEANKTMF